jgi:hypothetical protein
MNQENKDLNDVEIGNDAENLEQFDRCTLTEHYCGFKTKDGFCLSKTRCAYSQFEQWTSKTTLNERSTIEEILFIENKHGRSLNSQEILSMTPKDELMHEVATDSEGKTKSYFFIVDAKGNVFDIVKHRIIKRNLKL